MSNFASRIAEAAGRFADRPAIEVVRPDIVETTTYHDLMERSARVAGWLTSQGLERGDRVAVLAGNDADWIVLYLGVLRVGLVAVPLDTNYVPAQVRTIVEDSGARWLFTAPRLIETARAAQHPHCRAAHDGGDHRKNDPACGEAKPL